MPNQTDAIAIIREKINVFKGANAYYVTIRFEKGATNQRGSRLTN
jgi:hypothetical protein